MDFSKRLKMLRNEKKLKQKQLADYLSYGHTAISNYESGRNEPSIADLKKIAKYFNVSLDYLMGVIDIRNPYDESNHPEEIEELINLFTQMDNANQTWVLRIMRSAVIENDSTGFFGTMKVAEEVAPYRTSGKEEK